MNVVTPVMCVSKRVMNANAGGRPKSKMSMKEKARQFAVQAHGDQEYGDQPYEAYLRECRQFGVAPL